MDSYAATFQSAANHIREAQELALAAATQAASARTAEFDRSREEAEALAIRVSTANGALERLAEAERQIVALEGRKAALIAEVQTQTNALEAARLSREGVEADLQAANQRLVTVGAKASAVEQEVMTLEGQKTALTAEVAALVQSAPVADQSTAVPAVLTPAASTDLSSN